MNKIQSIHGDSGENVIARGSWALWEMSRIFTPKIDMRCKGSNTQKRRQSRRQPLFVKLKIFTKFACPLLSLSFFAHYNCTNVYWREKVHIIRNVICVILCTSVNHDIIFCNYWKVKKYEQVICEILLLNITYDNLHLMFEAEADTCQPVSSWVKHLDAN